MKSIVLIMSLLGIFKPDQKHSYLDRWDIFTKGEMRFIKNVAKLANKDPYYVYKQDNGKIAMLFDDQRVVLGKDGFIHDLHILENGEWIDLGPEY